MPKNYKFKWNVMRHNMRTHIIIILIVVLYLPSSSQVRFDSLLHVLNRRYDQKLDSTHIIIFKFVDVCWYWTAVTFTQDTLGNWHGKYFRTNTTRKKKADGSYEYSETYKNYELTPKSNWTNVIAKLYSLGIDTLCSQGSYARVRDGTLCQFIYKSPDKKNVAIYRSPELFKHRHRNDRRAVKLLRFRRKYFKMKPIVWDGRSA